MRTFTSALAGLAVTSLAAQTNVSQVRELADGRWEIAVERTIPVEFLGTIQPFILWDSTARFPDERVRDRHGVLKEIKEREGEVEGRRGHPAVDPTAQPQGPDPALQTAAPLHGFERAVDISVNGMGNTGVSPADPCLSVGSTHVIQMINGSSGGYFRIYDKNLANPGTQTYLDNFVNALGDVSNYSGLGDPIVLWDDLADRWVMTEFSSSGNRLIVAVSTSTDPTGSWNAYSFTAPGFPDYPKYAVWSDCYVVTTNESTPAVYALPRAAMLAGTAGTAVRFTVSSYSALGFQATTPVHFGGGAAPPAGAPAMFMRMADDLWTTSTSDVDRLEMWNINYNAATPASSTITGPTNLNTETFDSALCGYTTLNCINQPGSQTMDPIRELLMNRVYYRNLTTFGYEAIAATHAVDVNETDRAAMRWYELHRVGGSANPWSIHQQGTYSPDANDRWMGSIAINANGDIGLSYNVAGTTGGNVYPGIRYTGRYKDDPLNQMTFAETSIVAGSASNNGNRYGDYGSLDVDPVDGTSFYGTAMYNPAANWGTRIFKFSFPANTGCSAPVAAATPTCAGTTQYNVSVNLTSMGSATSIALQVDNDAGGPNGYTTVQTVTGTGTYGPFGPYTTGAAVNVRLVHNLDANCNLNLNNVVAVCDGPGSGCQYTSTTTTNIVDNTTVTNTITVPSQGGATIADLNVYVNITHSYVSDLRLTLQSPAGTTVALINSGLCTDNDNITVEFNQQAAAAIGSVCPMANLFAIPATSLAAFNGQVLQGTWTLSVQDVATQDAGTINSWCLIPQVTTPNVQVSPKIFLEGPYSTGTGLMSDALRLAGLVPIQEPYTGLGYGHTGGGGGESTTAAVLATTGPNAPVDWVVVELRDPGDPTLVLASRSALLQRDGDVVDTNGVSPVRFPLSAGWYHVAVRHRNHLGAMTEGAVALSIPAASADFTSAATPVYGTDARRSISGAFPAMTLWAGDVTRNKEAKYTGVGNDRDMILLSVGSATPNATASGLYSAADVNMDGLVRYTGTANDRDRILITVGSTTPNTVRPEQLPQ